MSYCRFLEADAYIVGTVRDGKPVIECCGCTLTGDGEFPAFDTEDGMLAHIAEHRAAGHFIPAHVDERLNSEKRQRLSEEPRNG